MVARTAVWTVASRADLKAGSMAVWMAVKKVEKMAETTVG